MQGGSKLPHSKINRATKWSCARRERCARRWIRAGGCASIRVSAGSWAQPPGGGAV